MWNNITTEITDANGNVVEFLDGDTVTVTVLMSDDGENAVVTFNSSTSGLTDLSLDGGSLCLKDVQWAIGSAPQEFMPDFNFAFFEECSATAMPVGSGNAGGTGGVVVTPEGGSLVNLVLLEGGIDNIQAEPEDLSGQGFRIEFQPDD